MVIITAMTVSKIMSTFLETFGIFICLMMLSLTLPENVTAQNILHRINCGSTQQVVVPPNNIIWAPDTYSTPGLTYNTCGNITTSIYCTSRFFRAIDTAPHRYNLPISVSNRTYEVRLHFAEHVRLLLLLFTVFVIFVLIRTASLTLIFLIVVLCKSKCTDIRRFC